MSTTLVLMTTGRQDAMLTVLSAIIKRSRDYCVHDSPFRKRDRSNNFEKTNKAKCFLSKEHVFRHFPFAVTVLPLYINTFKIL